MRCMGLVALQHVGSFQIVEVLYRTRTWWSRVNNKKIKERKRLIFLGLHRKPIKPLHRACPIHEGLRHPLNGVKAQSTF